MMKYYVASGKRRDKVETADRTAVKLVRIPNRRMEGEEISVLPGATAKRGS